MSLFSFKPKNRRRRSRAKSQKETWNLLNPEAVSTKSGKKAGDLGDKAYQLNAQIGAIETFLAKKIAADARRAEMKRDNILPPPDKTANHHGKKKQLSHAERRRYHAERSRNGLHFLMLFVLACGLGWWLIFSGI